MSEKKVQTKKIVKRRLKLKGVLILALFCVAIFFSVKALIQVNVGAVTVKGNNYLKDSDIIKQAGLYEDTKYFKFSTSRACDTLEENAFIKTCKINRSLSFNLEIEIEENKPLFFYSYESQTILSDGSRTGEANTYGLPTLINFVSEDVLNEFISGLANVNSDIIRSISEIEYAPSTSGDGTIIDEERFMLSMNDGNTVYVNNKRLSTLNHYDTIYASIGDVKGTFNFDCDFGNYVFTKYEE